MNPLIKVEDYTLLFYNSLLFIVITCFFLTQFKGFRSNHNVLKFIGILTLFLVTIYMGLRPIDQVFGDMILYAKKFDLTKQYDAIISDDIGFNFFMNISSKILPVNIFFLLCSIVYIFPLYLVSKKWFNNLWYFSFFILICSLSFWGYGVNGIRNGMATSIFLLGLYYENNRKYLIICFIISFLFHKSLILPIIAYLLTFVNNNPKNYFLFWLVSIPISLILGSTFELQIKNLTFITEGRDAYFDNSVDSAKFSRTGFRWDFVIYSSIGIIVAYFSVIKKKYSDELYIRILNIYLFCNAFWILIIRASFSNRFAYLSWFLLGLIIIYPFLKVKIIKNQYRFIGLILAVYYLITYTLNVILK